LPHAMLQSAVRPHNKPSLLDVPPPQNHAGLCSAEAPSQMS
jgi:hypothetical protein